jgi:hypothetical protein
VLGFFGHRPSWHRNLLLSIPVIAFVLWGLAYIRRASFPIQGKRYFHPFDDAMISMRYARNLAAGHSLVWNTGGEKVEGLTNPLWTVLNRSERMLADPADGDRIARKADGGRRRGAIQEMPVH